MASTTQGSSANKARPMPADVKKDLAAKRKKKTPATSTKVRAIFLPGSLNDVLSKLEVGESHARCKRIPLDGSNNVAEINDKAQEYFQKQNSILSGGIAKVRAANGHSAKRFKMERGTYMTASNDAMFAFLSVTRME